MVRCLYGMCPSAARWIIRASVALVVGAAALPAAAQMSLEDAADALALDRCAAVEIDVPGKPGDLLGLTVVLDGKSETIELERHSLRAPGFRVALIGANGAEAAVAPPPVATYRGHVLGRPRTRVAATLHERGLTAAIHDPEDERSWYVQPLPGEAGRAGAGGRVHAVYGREDVRSGPWSCGSTEAGVAAPAFPEAPSGTPVGASCIATTLIAFDADHEFFLLNDADVAQTVVDIETVMNGVDLAYNIELGIAYSITEIKVRAEDPDPYTTTDPFGMLDEFRLEWDTNCTGVVRDVAHLMTGKDLDGTVVGLGAYGVVCREGLAYALSQSSYSLNMADRVALTAHELGHNWGAGHCNVPACPPDQPACQKDCAIMCTNINGCDGPLLTFGGQSTQEIQAYAATLTCLDLVTDDTVVVFPGLVQLIAGDAGENDFFGFSVDVAQTADGSYAIVGANFHDTIVDDTSDPPEVIQDAGAAYAFRYDGASGIWVQEQKLLANDSAAFDRFGTAVAVDGDIALVGVPLDDLDGAISAGSVHLYRRGPGGWAFEVQLTADDPTGDANFGAAVDVSGGLIIIGAPGMSATGAVYFYREEFGQWVLVEMIQPEELGVLDAFGQTVAIFEDAAAGGPSRAIVGAFGTDEVIDDTDVIPNVGAAYVFIEQFTSWSLEAMLLASDREAGDELGSAVAAGRGVVAVGAWKDDDNGENAGAVYIYEVGGFSEWEERAKIMSPAPGFLSRFGASTALADDFLVVGAHRDDLLGNNSGAAYGYAYLGVSDDPDAAGWQFVGRVASNPGDEGNQFGIAVAADRHLAGVGSWFDDGPAMGSGSAEVFFIAGDCDDDGVTDVCQIAMGLALDCNGNGVPDGCDIADGIAQDDNGDGVPDECFTDCNGNLVDDLLDVDPTDPDGDGSVSPDCNLNGVPDECESVDCNGNGVSDICEIAANPGIDCNGNGVPDDCDITAMTSSDCNGDGVPDECGLHFSLTSPFLGPVGGNAPQTWNAVGTPQADGNVTIRLAAHADLDLTSEFLDLFVDDIPVGILFRLGARQCPLEDGHPFDEADLLVARDAWNEARSDGIVTIDVVASEAVDETQCAVPSSLVRITVEYPTGDCNGNGAPDVCDIADGTSVDGNGDGVPDECECLSDSNDCNDNGVPDACDILTGTSSDANDNGIPDECECAEDTNGDQIVDVNDLLQVIAQWGACPGCAGDINDDDIVDVNDLLLVIGAWGPCF